MGVVPLLIICVVGVGGAGLGLKEGTDITVGPIRGCVGCSISVLEGSGVVGLGVLGTGIRVIGRGVAVGLGDVQHTLSSVNIWEMLPPLVSQSLLLTVSNPFAQSNSGATPHLLKPPPSSYDLPFGQLEQQL